MGIVYHAISNPASSICFFGTVLVVATMCCIILTRANFKVYSSCRRGAGEVEEGEDRRNDNVSIVWPVIEAMFN